MLMRENNHEMYKVGKQEQTHNSEGKYQKAKMQHILYILPMSDEHKLLKQCPLFN